MRAFDLRPISQIHAFNSNLINYKESPNNITSYIFLSDCFYSRLMKQVRRCSLVCISELYHILWTWHFVVSGHWLYRHSLWTQSRWEGTDRDLRVVLQCLDVLFSMRVYTSVTIEMWHNHLVTELLIKCCSFVVSLKTDIYLPWSQRVGEWSLIREQTER